VAPDDSDRDNPLQRWLEAEQRLADPETGREDSAARGEAFEAEWSDSEARRGDPEARWGDPDGGFGQLPGEAADGESLDGDLADVEVDDRTRKYFWSAVALANIALAAVSVGLMLIGFRGQWALGGGLVLVGLLAGARTYRISRQFQADGETGPDAGVADESG
jgi:hypothetical protein